MKNTDEVVIDGGGPILIPPGQYEATLVRSAKVYRFDRLMYRMQFKIVTLCPFQGTMLDAWVSLNTDGNAGKCSKLVRWFMNIQPSASRWDRVPMKDFKDRLLVIEVRTVTRDSRQKPLPETQHYSVVAEIVGTLGRIGAGR